MPARETTKTQIKVTPEPAEHAKRLLRWFDRHARILPWRARPGERGDPYRVWLSEIMLQQTTVAAVMPYFDGFTKRWPDVRALAEAPLDDVLVAWQGLGYYARARNLVKCARVVAEDHGGMFPADREALLSLPGIGPYTAAAIGAIAFDRPEVVVDGNVERVIARLFAVADPLPGAKPELRRLAASLTPDERPGDYAQAMMDLGATVCTPRSPKCGICPLAAECRANALGEAAAYPKRARRAKKPVRRGTAWFAVNERGEVLLRRRPEDGLLGGMMEVPSSAWEEGAAPAPALPDGVGRWQVLDAPVDHVFTHFRLELTVAWARLKAKDADKLAPGGLWAAPDALHRYALPTVQKKVCRAALAALEAANPPDRE